MVLGKLPVLGRPNNLISVGQGPTALAEGVNEGLLGHFSLVYHYFLSLSLSEGDGPVYTEILSQMVVKLQTTKQPI